MLSNRKLQSKRERSHHTCDADRFVLYGQNPSGSRQHRIEPCDGSRCVTNSKPDRRLGDTGVWRDSLRAPVAPALLPQQDRRNASGVPIDRRPFGAQKIVLSRIREPPHSRRIGCERKTNCSAHQIVLEARSRSRLRREVRPGRACGNPLVDEVVRDSRRASSGHQRGDGVHGRTGVIDRSRAREEMAGDGATSQQRRDGRQRGRKLTRRRLLVSQQRVGKHADRSKISRVGKTRELQPKHDVLRRQPNACDVVGLEPPRNTHRVDRSRVTRHAKRHGQSFLRTGVVGQRKRPRARDVENDGQLVARRCGAGFRVKTRAPRRDDLSRVWDQLDGVAAPFRPSEKPRRIGRQSQPANRLAVDGQELLSHLSIPAGAEAAVQVELP